jgi:hypothetical protein
MNHGALILPRPKGNFFFITIDIEWISLAPTSIWGLELLKKGHPRMRGDSFVTSMSSTTKQTGMKQPWIFTEMSLAIPAG